MEIGLVFVYLMSMNIYGAEDDGKMKPLISPDALDITMLNKCQCGKAEKTNKWKLKCRKGYVNQSINKRAKKHRG